MNRLRPSKLILGKFPTQRFPSIFASNSFKKQPLQFLINASFSTSTAWGDKGNKDNSFKYGAIMTRADSNLASALGWEDMGDVEDRFQLSKIYDVKKVFSILRQTNYKHPLNDLVHFLRRIVELNEEKNLKLTVQNSMELSSFVEEIKRALRHGEQDYPLIGSYAWCFWKLGHREDAELWLTLGDHIVDGRFHTNFNESMCGIEGFTALEGVAEQPFIDEVYKRLEKVLVLTIVEVDINHYKRLTESLIKVQRFTKYVFENIENHLMHFLSSHNLEYNLKLMLDILACFAISGTGSERLFYSFQDIFNTYFSMEPERQEELHHGEFVSKLIQTYALAKMIHPELVYDHTFSRLVYKMVLGKEIVYNLEELVNVIQHIGMFNFEAIEEINRLLDERVFEVVGEMKGGDMIRYIDLKVLRDYEGDYSKTPNEIIKFFDDYLTKNMEKQEAGQIYRYISEVEERGLMNGKEEILNHLITYVSNRLHIYDFEALCYFYWLFNKYNSMIKMENAKIQCDLSSIKDHIRLYSAFSKGRLMIGSNFYKMLEVVSGSDFLTQGEYPEW